MKKNVYKVGYGMISAGDSYDVGIGKLHVVAKDAKGAIKKADKKLEAGEYATEGGVVKWAEVFESIVFVLTIDVE